MLLDPDKKSATLSMKVIPLACKATLIFIRDEVKCVMLPIEEAELCWISKDSSQEMRMKFRVAIRRMVGSDKRLATIETRRESG